MNFSSNFQYTSNLEAKVEEALIKVFQKLPEFCNLEKNAYVSQCQNLVSHYHQYQHLLVLGIGGSALGTSAILQALGKENKVTVLDTIDPEFFEKKINQINWDHTLVNVISKSGSTLETAFQLSFVEKLLKKKFKNSWSEKIVCTTGKNSLLEKHALKNNYKTLPVPEGIGGRFSVLTPVGLFPLLFAGIDVANLLDLKITQEALPALKPFVLAQYFTYQNQKKNITVLMTYQKKLLGLLDWYRQLLAESLGKNSQVGITPTLAFGSTDQHSQIQLFTEGPQDKLIVFLSADFLQKKESFTVLGMNKKINITETNQALLAGTKKGLSKHHRPFVEYFLDQVNEKKIGQFLITSMLQIVVLAELFQVNAFDQPGVEEGKIQTKKILGASNKFIV